MKRWLFWVLLGSILALSLPAHAQDGERKRRHKRLADMTDKELSEAGFEWEAKNSYKGSLVAGSVAAVPGFFFHGLGHFYAGDKENGWSILLSEGIGVGMMLSGLLLYATNKESGFFAESGLATAQVGGIIFSLGYLSDVVGSFKGSESRLPDLFPQHTGLSAQTSYRLLNVPGLKVHNLIEAEGELDFGFFFARPEVSIGALLNYQRYGCDFGLRLVEGRSNHDSLSFVVHIDRASFAAGSGVQRHYATTTESGVQTELADAVLRLRGFAELSLDMEQFIDHLSNMIMVSTVGIGFADGVGPRAAFPGNRSTSFLILRQSLLFHLSSRVAVKPFYRYEEAELVGQLGAGFGSIGSEVFMRPRKDFELSASAEKGEGYSVMMGVRYLLH